MGAMKKAIRYRHNHIVSLDLEMKWVS